MAKYFVTLVLFTCIALESTSIHSRLFAKSEVSTRPRHYLRHQKHLSTETGDHNAHRQHDRHHIFSHLPHQRSHHDNDYDEQQDEEIHEENRHAEEFENEEAPFDQDSHNDEPEDDSSSYGRYKPNLWHILHNELSRSSGTASSGSSSMDDIDHNNDDEADMLRDGIFGEPKTDQVHIKSKSFKSQTAAAPILKCPKCESNSQNVRVSEEELTRLRIEFVKRQILQKLRLKDKPNVAAGGMPKPIYEETTIQQDEKTTSKDLDDYYARAKKKFIFLEREKHECHHLNQPSICFSFKIDDLDAESIDVSTAVLWIFKKRCRKDLLKQTIVVSEVEQGGHNSKYLPKVKPIAIQSVDVQEGWMKIDIEWPIKRWFGNHDLSHLIHISCQSCEDSADNLISTEKDYRPFIMIDTQNRRRVSRQKRSVNCTDGVTECCREKLYISFDEIGWGDWVIRPRGYDAYFCRGSCSTAASIAQSTTHHSSVMRKVISHRDTNGKKPLELIPCCTANQYSSLEIFFRDSNNTASLMKFTNMVIESCGCM